MNQSPPKSQESPAKLSLEQRVEKLEVIGDQNAEIFANTLASIDLRLLTVTAVLNDMVGNSCRRKGTGGPIDWDSYMNEQEVIVQKQEAEALNRRSAPTELPPRIETTTTPEDYPSGAIIFGGP